MGRMGRRSNAGAAATAIVGLGGVARTFTLSRPLALRTTQCTRPSERSQRAAGFQANLPRSASRATQTTAASAVLRSAAVDLAAGTLASAVTLAAVLRQTRRRNAKSLLRRHAAASEATVEDAAASARFVKASENLVRYDFGKLEEYPQEELEELYTDALWCYYSQGQKIVEDKDFDVLKQLLKKAGSKFPTLKRKEVEFVEASIAYYRGQPIVSDEVYSQLKADVKKSGRRKDLTSFILTQRGKQYLNNEQLSKLQEAFKNATEVDFTKLDQYPLAELDELYIDALWCHYREKRALLKDAEFDKLKQVLYKLGSRFPTLSRAEVAFVEASIQYYRGEAVVSDEEYESLKAEVEKSGRRKDVTAFLLYERGEQFLDGDQFASMKEEYEKLGLAAVNLEECTLAQLEEMYVDALWAYYKDGVQLLSDEQYKKLKQELEWQGSGFPTLRRYEIDFVKASVAYWRGEPVASDEEWKELKKKVLQDGKRKDVTAFLLYSKGMEALDPETFDRMKEEMMKLGVNVKKAGTKALDQTLSISSDRLENDLSQVLLMVISLGALPTILCTVLVWSAGLFFDFEFVPQPEWSSVLSAEAVPLFVAGLSAGALLTWRLFVFLDLQNPEILLGVCPSCSKGIKLFNGGDAPPTQVEYSCTACGCKMVLDSKQRIIQSAGLGAKIEGPDQGFDWAKAWRSVKVGA